MASSTAARKTNSTKAFTTNSEVRVDGHQQEAARRPHLLALGHDTATDAEHGSKQQSHPQHPPRSSSSTDARSSARKWKSTNA